MINKKFFEDKLISLDQQLNKCSIKDYNIYEQDFFTIGLILNNYYNQKIPNIIETKTKFNYLSDNIKSSFYLLSEFEKEYSYLSFFDYNYLELYSYKYLNLKEKEIFDLINEFFKDKSYFYKFLKNLNKNNITFFTQKEPISATYHLLSTNENFIFIELEKNILSITTLAHELAHLASLDLNNNRFTNPNSIIFKEVESLFIELLACDFIDNYYNFKEGLTRKKELYNLIMEDAKTALRKKEVLSYYDYIKFLNLKEQLQYLYTINKNYNVKNLLSIFNTKLTADFLYTISFLIAIELYYAYQDNPKYTLEVLKKIITYNEDDYYNYLNNMEINIGLHTKKFIQELKKSSKIE